MKSKVFLLFLIFITLLIPFTYCTEMIEPYYPTKEELGGYIKIPNREGNQDHYTDINTYEELYSVLEDLSMSYKDLLEEYNDLEHDYSELYNELSNKNEENKNLGEELEGIQNRLYNKEHEAEDFWTYIYISVIIGLSIYIYYIKNK